jgi:hypothetical protein
MVDLHDIQPAIDNSDDAFAGAHLTNSPLAVVAEMSQFLVS